MDTKSIARSGMDVALQRLQSHAHNLANAGTEGFRRSSVVQAERAGGGTTAAWSRATAEGPAMADDLVGQMTAGHHFRANLAVFKTHDAMAGALLDAVA
jgi:flagellar hook protein FlgE